jgi:diguanylate cyclase (GGDEF)-like protein
VLSFQALHDPLTGLGNRSSLLAALEDALAKTRAGTEGLAVLYVDLDRFKTVNDSFGHPVGDRVLVALAARLADGVRPSDHVGRIGGDEFAAVLPTVRDEAGALQVAQRLLEAMGTPVPLGDGPLATSASIGVVFSADGHETPTELLRRADVAMYQAKDRGRARVECWRSPGSARHVERRAEPPADEHQG